MKKLKLLMYLFPPFKLRRNYLLSFHNLILVGISCTLDHKWCFFPVNLRFYFEKSKSKKDY